MPSKRGSVNSTMSKSPNKKVFDLEPRTDIQSTEMSTCYTCCASCT